MKEKNNQVETKINWILGQIGLHWKINEKRKNLGGERFDHNTRILTTYSAKTANGTQIILQEGLHLYRYANDPDDRYCDIVHTDKSDCKYRIQITPKNGDEFSYGARVKNLCPNDRNAGLVERLFEGIEDELRDR